MNCDELMTRLVDFLGGELVVEIHQTVEIHLAGCPKCKAYVTTYTHTVRIARVLPKCGKLPPAFEARLRAALEPELGGEKKG